MRTDIQCAAGARALGVIGIIYEARLNDDRCLLALEGSETGRAARGSAAQIFESRPSRCAVMQLTSVGLPADTITTVIRGTRPER